MNHSQRSIAWQRQGLCLTLFSALTAFVQAQNTDPQLDRALVGTWVAESITDVQGITDDRGIQRWSVERKADGTYSAHQLLVRRDGVKERDVEGRWHTQSGVLHMDPPLDTGTTGAWRYEAHQADCWRMEAVDAASGAPLKPPLRFGECRALIRWPVPNQVHRTCVMAPPLTTERMEIDYRITLEPDGKRYVTANGARDSIPVEVRDYPVLRDFDPRKVETMTNAGEAMLTLVQSSIEVDQSFARTLGFKPRDVRGVRIYVLDPPRSHRLMEYYNAGHSTMLEAMDSNGKSMGMAMYTPFIVPCPRAAGN